MTRLHLVEDGEEPSPRVSCLCGSKVPALQVKGKLLVTHCLKCCSPELTGRRPSTGVSYLDVVLFIMVVGVITTLIVGRL